MSFISSNKVGVHNQILKLAEKMLECHMTAVTNYVVTGDSSLSVYILSRPKLLIKETSVC